MKRFSNVGGGGNLTAFSREFKSFLKQYILCQSTYFGFTLAEVLITLGIIGVVAALTLPAVINNTEKKERQEALKKAYSTLQQALLMYQKDIGELPTQDTFNSSAETFKKAILSYFSGAIDCGKGTENTACMYAYATGSGTNNPYRNYSNSTEALRTKLDDGQFIVTDGMMYFFENPGTGGNIYVSVDVNGFKKLPNRWGHDLFTFELTDTGKLLPMGAVGTMYEKNADSYCSKTSTSSLNGIACTNRALYDQSFWK